MTITPAIVALIMQRLRAPGLPKVTQSSIGNKLGYGRAWASKFMDGKIKNLDDEKVAELEDYLGIRLMAYFQENTGDRVPDLAVQLGKKMQRSPLLSKIISALLEVETWERDPDVATLRWIPTQEMSRIGQEIIKIAFADEDKPGKVARRVIEILTAQK